MSRDLQLPRRVAQLVPKEGLCVPSVNLWISLVANFLSWSASCYEVYTANWISLTPNVCLQPPPRSAATREPQAGEARLWRSAARQGWASNLDGLPKVRSRPGADTGEPARTQVSRIQPQHSDRRRFVLSAECNLSMTRTPPRPTDDSHTLDHDHVCIQVLRCRQLSRTT